MYYLLALGMFIWHHRHKDRRLIKPQTFQSDRNLAHATLMINDVEDADGLLTNAVVYMLTVKFIGLPFLDIGILSRY